MPNTETLACASVRDVVVHGSGRMKLDDEIVELEEWDAVRVPPGT